MKDRWGFPIKYHKFKCPICGDAPFVNENGSDKPNPPPALERHIVKYHPEAIGINIYNKYIKK